MFHRNDLKFHYGMKKQYIVLVAVGVALVFFWQFLLPIF